MFMSDSSPMKVAGILWSFVCKYIKMHISVWEFGKGIPGTYRGKGLRESTRGY